MAALPTRTLVLAAAAWLAACGAGDDARETARPHIVLVVVDDLGMGDPGFTGGDLATPRIDALAAESVVLERFYAAPMCSPARAQLLTGRHALSLGMTRNVKPRDTAGLPPGVPTIADRLREAGYRTALVGKWHLGHAEASQHPLARGFESSYGLLRGWIDYLSHEIDGIRDWQRDGEPIVEEGYATDLIAAEARRVIGGHDGARPLFLVVSFNAPHAPLQPPPGVRATGERAAYAAMVERLDEGVGQVLDALERRGIADDTVVWFLSDNGANPRHGGSNGALSGAKYTCHEGGVRVPACVRLPARAGGPGGACSAFVAAIDVAPTLAAMAGAAPLPETDGADATDALLGRGDAPRRDLVFAVDHARVQRRALLRPPWKVIEERRGSDVSRMLFDVVADPLEEVDRAAERPDVVADLLAAAPWSPR